VTVCASSRCLAVLAASKLEVIDWPVLDGLVLDANEMRRGGGDVDGWSDLVSVVSVLDPSDGLLIFLQ
jgi:hypothetical protein